MTDDLENIPDDLELEPEEKEDLDFEEALNRLEEVVEKLEEGSLTLDKSLAKFLEGVRLIKFCNQKLSEAEKKIEVVLKDEEGFSDIVPFSQEEEQQE